MIASDVALTSPKGNGAIPLAEHAMWLMLTRNRDALRRRRQPVLDGAQHHLHVTTTEAALGRDRRPDTPLLA